MRWHVLRPLWVVVGLFAVVVVARYVMVPADFGIHGKNFTYGFYRLSNVQEWKDFPVKYQGRESCTECHEEKVQSVIASPHQAVECENCHGPAIDHPMENESFVVDTSRELCLRCHADLQYANSSRAALPGIDANEHNREFECSECHNPHEPP